MLVLVGNRHYRSPVPVSDPKGAIVRRHFVAQVFGSFDVCECPSLLYRKINGMNLGGARSILFCTICNAQSLVRSMNSLASFPC